MRGFVITMISVSLLLVLLALALSLHNSQNATERELIEPLPLSYASFILDDAAGEFNSIVGPDMAFNETNESMSISVADTIDPYNHSSEISMYKAFLENEVADSMASNITTNFTNITGGTVKVFMDQDYIYQNDHGNSEVIFTRNGGTNASSYDISFAVYSIRQNVTHMVFNQSGTMNITIHYTDLNGTDTEEGAIFPDRYNVFEVDYANGTRFVVSAGLYNTNPGSLRMKSYGVWAENSWTVALPRLDPSIKRGYEYDATITYSQGSLDVTRRFGK